MKAFNCCNFFSLAPQIFWVDPWAQLKASQAQKEAPKVPEIRMVSPWSRSEAPQFVEWLTVFSDCTSGVSLWCFLFSGINKLRSCGIEIGSKCESLYSLPQCRCFKVGQSGNLGPTDLGKQKEEVIFRLWWWVPSCDLLDFMWGTFCLYMSRS